MCVEPCASAGVPSFRSHALLGTRAQRTHRHPCAHTRTQHLSEHEPMRAVAHRSGRCAYAWSAHTLYIASGAHALSVQHVSLMGTGGGLQHIGIECPSHASSPSRCCGTRDPGCPASFFFGPPGPLRECGWRPHAPALALCCHSARSHAAGRYISTARRGAGWASRARSLRSVAFERLQQLPRILA